MSYSITSDSAVGIPRNGQVAALAVLDHYLAKDNAFQIKYLEDRLSKLGLARDTNPSGVIAYLFGGAMDLPLLPDKVSIDPATDAVVLNGFAVSYEDGDSPDPVADVLNFLARLAPAVVPGSVVIFTADPHRGPLYEVDYRVELKGGGVPIIAQSRMHWAVNQQPWSPAAD